MGAKETHLKILWSEGAGAKKTKIKKKYSGQQHHRNVVLYFRYYTFLLIKTHYIYIYSKKSMAFYYFCWLFSCPRRILIHFKGLLNSSSS